MPGGNLVPSHLRDATARRIDEEKAWDAYDARKRDEERNTGKKRPA